MEINKIFMGDRFIPFKMRLWDRIFLVDFIDPEYDENNNLTRASNVNILHRHIDHIRIIYEDQHGYYYIRIAYSLLNDSVLIFDEDIDSYTPTKAYHDQFYIFSTKQKAKEFASHFITNKETK